MSLEKMAYELRSDVMRSRGPITCTHRCIHGCPEIQTAICFQGQKKWHVMQRSISSEQCKKDNACISHSMQLACGRSIAG